MNKLTRRQLLRGSAILSLGILAAGCAPAATPEATPQPTRVPESAQKAPEAAPTPTGMPATPPTAQTQAAPAASPVAPPPTVEAVAPDARIAGPMGLPYMAVAHGADPETITMRAIAAIGGMERFVRNGYDVIIKPNICNANHGPEYASTTNPEVVAALVKMCLAAGAKQVRVMDYPFSGTGPQAYVTSGIEAAVVAAGGEMEAMAPHRFVETQLPEGQDLRAWPIYQPVLDADLVINVPIAKHHSLCRLTLGSKNLLGVIQTRGAIHQAMGRRIADIASRVRPELTVIDAVRILMANGPTGGNLDDVKRADTVIASHDMVAADAYATTLFDLKPDDISYIVAQAARGMGTMDLDHIGIDEFNV